MREKQSKVSVIIPVYNTEKYLEECINSVISQTLSDIEIICVDGGSTDHSIDILMKYAERDERIRLICQENRGLSSARNAGLRCAKGEYVYFLDSDDILEPEALMELTAIADKKELDILCLNSDSLFESEEMRIKYGDIAQKNKRSCAYTSIGTGAEVFRRMYWQKDYQTPVWGYLFSGVFLKEKNLWFYEGIIHGDELFTLIALLEAQSVSHEDRIYIHHRIRKDSIMYSGISYKDFKGYFVAYVELMNYMQNHTFERAETVAIWDKIISLRRAAYARYSELPSEERKGITWTNDPSVHALFKMSEYVEREDKAKRLKTTEAKLKTTEKKLLSTQKEMMRLKKEPVIWLWLKFRGGIRCLKQNGVVYTFRRVGQKVRAFIGRRLSKNGK